MTKSSVALHFNGGSATVNSHLHSIYYVFSNLLRQLSVLFYLILTVIKDRVMTSI